jgi:hypothetical protein
MQPSPQQAFLTVPAGVLSLHMQVGLARLLQSYHYAQDIGCDRWDFAVEIQGLQAVGLTTSDLRWLVCAGYLTHAVETAWGGRDHRTFRRARVEQQELRP